MNNKILLGIAAALSVYAIINGAVYAQETTRNTTTTVEEQNVPAEVVGTGQESIPVITANGSDVVQAAPADAVNSLLTTIFTVAVPAITGLVVAVVAIIKTFSKDKKVNEALDIATVAAKYVDTFAPKVQEQYIASGAFKTAFEMMMNSLPAEQKKTIEEEIVKNVPPTDLKVQAAAAQINKLRNQLPKQAQAGSDPSIGNLDHS